MDAIDLRRTRENLNMMTRAELARRLGVGVSVVGKWESGKLPVPTAIVLALKTIQREETLA